MIFRRSHYDFVGEKIRLRTFARQKNLLFSIRLGTDSWHLEKKDARAHRNANSALKPDHG